MDKYFATEIAEFARGFSWENAPQDSREVLRLSLLDWVCVGLAGLDQPVSLAVLEMLKDEASQTGAFVFGAKTTLPARAAALANGATSHALDYDDTHFLHIGHPSVVIFSAALAVAQQVGASGKAFLEASMVGIETSCRIGHWLGRGHYEAGFHMTATAGTFGAALACARLLGADPAQMLAALGLASTRASGLKAQFGSMGKPYNAGVAAANGAEAALLAVGGVTSDALGLDSFAASHAGEMNMAALEGLGEVFVTENISHKFHACCHGTHAMLEALAKLQVDPSEVSGVLITVHPRWLKVCNKFAPKTGLEAKFSYRICAAFTLAGLDTGALQTFSDANCADPNLQDLRDLVVVQGDDKIADGAARVTVSCHNDMARQASFDLDQPIGLQERTARVCKKAAALVGAQKQQRIRAQIIALTQKSDLTDFIDSLRD